MRMAAQYYINSPGCRRQLLIADFILKTEAEMGKTDNDITPFLGPQKVGYFLRRNNTGTVSKQMKRRPVLRAATAVVPEPAQMSATTSPGRV